MVDSAMDAEMDPQREINRASPLDTASVLVIHSATNDQEARPKQPASESESVA